MDKVLNILHLFPDLLNLYGDRGNILVLKKRCNQRGIDVNITEGTINGEISLTNSDIVFLGGGSDREQALVCEKLLTIKSSLHSYRDDNGVLLAVCGGYQLLGHYYSLHNEKIQGLSLCDLHTVSGEPRLIGNVAIKTEIGTVVGFENHSGRTYLGENEMPLGEVIFGYGNNNEDKTEGIKFKNIFGTYLHGPLLPKNPDFADLLIKNAMIRKYGECILEKLDDGFSDKAKEEVMKNI